MEEKEGEEKEEERKEERKRMRRRGGEGGNLCFGEIRGFTRDIGTPHMGTVPRPEPRYLGPFPLTPALVPCLCASGADPRTCEDMGEVQHGAWNISARTLDMDLVAVLTLNMVQNAASVRGEHSWR